MGEQAGLVLVQLAQAAAAGLGGMGLAVPEVVHILLEAVGLQLGHGLLDAFLLLGELFLDLGNVKTNRHFTCPPECA